LAAAVAVGEFNMQKALAAGPACCNPSGTTCPNCPSQTSGTQHCPTGYSDCVSGNCAYCWYASGHWDCNAGGPYYRCYDCWSGGNCGTACTCAKLLSCCAPAP
jgi:hypothetical protein